MSRDPRALARRKQDLQMASALARGQLHQAIDDIDRRVTGWQATTAKTREAVEAWGRAAIGVLTKPVHPRFGGVTRLSLVLIGGVALIAARWLAAPQRASARSTQSSAPKSEVRSAEARTSRYPQQPARSSGSLGWIVLTAWAWQRRGRQVATVWRWWRRWQRIVNPSAPASRAAGPTRTARERRTSQV